MSRKAGVGIGVGRKDRSNEVGVICETSHRVERSRYDGKGIIAEGCIWQVA